MISVERRGAAAAGHVLGRIAADHLDLDAKLAQARIFCVQNLANGYCCDEVRASATQGSVDES